MKVFKYQATGNDFIITKEIPRDPVNFAKAVCDRHFGIGADGILYPSISLVADIKMNYFNADGTVAKMCGNGLRAFARFLHDEHILIKDKFSVETLSGMYYVELLEDMVKVSMGPVNLNVGSPDLIETLDARTTYKFDNYFGYVLAVGTLHTVVYKHENGQMNILEVGPKIQNSTLFTDQTNVNFIDIINEHTIRVETYERGAGWTLSCGTGVSASVFHALLKGSIKGNKIHVYVPGGELDCIIHGPDIYLIGPAIRIMDGKFYEKN